MVDGRNGSKKEMETFVFVVVLLRRYAKWFLKLGFEVNLYLRLPHSNNAFIDWGFTLIPVFSLYMHWKDDSFCIIMISNNKLLHGHHFQFLHHY